MLSHHVQLYITGIFYLLNFKFYTFLAKTNISISAAVILAFLSCSTELTTVKISFQKGRSSLKCMTRFGTLFVPCKLKIKLK